MSDESRRADAPARWLSNAQADLALAKVTLPPGGLYEHLCFHAQQAVEKALKAVLLELKIPFPYTHNIQALLNLLPVHVKNLSELDECALLSPYAVITRYPGEFEPVSEADYRDAVRIAENVVMWALSIVHV
jgi:HEPN domain-containing protein